MRHVVLVAALGLGAAGCGPPRLDGIEPVAASLREVKMLGFSALGGASVGTAVVDILASDGSRFLVPAGMKSGTLGTFFEMAAWGGDLELDLSKAEVATASDIFGGYDGAHYDLAFTAGAVWYDLENEHGVKLAGMGLAVGVGMFAGHEWLALDPAGDPVEVDGEPATTSDAQP